MRRTLRRRSAKETYQQLGRSLSRYFLMGGITACFVCEIPKVMNITAQKIKERLTELGIRPSKGLGQNFLISDSTYKKIVEAGKIERGETILEIGPGLGTLTEHLLEAGVKVISLEKDHKLISFLTNLFSENKNLTILERDALKVNPHDFGLSENSYKVIANIPYYITSRLLRSIFEFWPRPALIVILVQHEVAHRIIAKPPHMNILAISVQYFAKLKIIAKVPKGSFYPMPNVDSAIIQITPIDERSDPVVEKQFFKVVRTGFSSKRKKLINNLAVGFNLDKKEVEDTLISLDIDINSRPENLTIKQWQELAKNLG